MIAALNTLTTVEDQPITLKLEDFAITDVDNTTGFTLSLQGDGANYTVSGTTVTPALNFTGILGVALVAFDGNANSNTISAQITVNEVNDPPTLDAISNVTIPEDSPEPTPISLTGITAGPGEGIQSLTVAVSSNKPEWFETLERTYGGGTTGSLLIKAKANVSGTAQIVVRIQDSGIDSPLPHVNFIERSFSFIIEPVNDPPVFTSQAVTLAEPGLPYEYIITVTDVEGEVITITAPTIPTWLTLTQISNGNARLSEPHPRVQRDR